jgi:putative transposase
LFEKDEDYASLEKVLDEAYRKVAVRVLAYCLMPNHWHLILWPRRDGDLSRYIQWLTTTHMRRWHAHRGTRGTGPVYQGRFKSFPVQEDLHFLVVCRYVERNPLRANLVARAEDWRWSSLWRRHRGEACEWLMAMSDWPAEAPPDWVSFVNRPETDEELEALRRGVTRGSPYGDATWQHQAAARLRLESTLRDPWRPRKATKHA